VQDGGTVPHYHDRPPDSKVESDGMWPALLVNRDMTGLRNTGVKGRWSSYDGVSVECRVETGDSSDRVVGVMRGHRVARGKSRLLDVLASMYQGKMIELLFSQCAGSLGGMDGGGRRAK
jgi:hypothetical protein